MSPPKRAAEDRLSSRIGQGRARARVHCGMTVTDCARCEPSSRGGGGCHNRRASGVRRKS
eukprot:6197732-Pleurochrysis_carterae.AAC.3